MEKLPDFQFKTFVCGLYHYALEGAAPAFDDVTLDVLYCDDTEVIEEHLANYQRCAEEHRQIAKWLEELKRRREVPVRLKEQISILRSKIKSLSNEYEKGFMSALSATEAMIATLEQEENND